MFLDANTSVPAQVYPKCVVALPVFKPCIATTYSKLALRFFAQVYLKCFVAVDKHPACAPRTPDFHAEKCT